MSPALVLAGVVACFALSGFAALIYQTAWLRQFSLVFGTSELAVATVLAAYMGGLALGAAVAGRFVARIRRPVLVYGFLEAAIAGSALAVPSLLGLAGALYAWVLGDRALPPDAASIGQPLFYLAAAFLVLALPTGFMGATLPLLTHHAVRSDRELGPRVALLYAANTAGAVLGTVTAAFVLLPAWGLRATVWCGVGVNLLVFAIAAALARRASPAAAAPTGRDAAAAPLVGFFRACVLPLFDGARPASARLRSVFQAQPAWILPLVFVSGANAFFYEVLWTRLLAHVLGGSLTAFATMLAAFLSGIALGGGLAGRLAVQRARAARAFALAQVGVALLSMAVYAWLGLRVPQTRGEAALAAYAVAVLLPATVFLGATYPLAVRILARHAGEAAAASARIYAWNTLGAIVGAVLAGFVLIPRLGFEGAIELAVCTNLVLALWTLVCVAPARREYAALAGAALLAVALLYQPARPRALIESSGFPAPRLAEAQQLFYAVGRSSTVLLLRVGGAYHLRANGLPEGLIRARGSPPGLESAGWLGALPVVARPDARTMLVVGFGGGTSLEGIPPSISNVDVVELEPEVIRANRVLSGRREQDPLADMRIRVVVNDGRNALRLTSKTYDAIVSQPSHPWTAGASHLFTREFLRLARQHLNPGGVFVQWMDSSLVSEPLLRSLAATLRAEFAHVRLYRPTPVALIFLASDETLELELEAARSGRPFADDPGHFGGLGLRCLEDLVAALALDGGGVAALAAGAPPSTDDDNRMATRSRSRFDGLDAEALSRLLDPHDPLRAGGWLHARLGEELHYPYLAQRLARVGQGARADRLAPAILDGSARLSVEGLAYERSGDRRRAGFAYQAALAADPADMQARYLLLGDRLDGSDAAQALEGPLAAVARGRQRARSGDWESLARLDPELARSHVTDVWYPEAARLRAEWRIRSARDRARLAREALAIVDGALHLSLDPELRRLRMECALALGDADLLAESARSIANGIQGRLSRAGSAGAVIPPTELARMRSHLGAINAQLAGPLGADHAGAQEVLRQSRAILERVERMGAQSGSAGLG